MKQNIPSSEIRIQSVSEDDFLYLRAKFGGSEIGFLKAHLLGNSEVLLADICVKCEIRKKRTWAERFNARLFDKEDFLVFRGQGLGSELLRRFFIWCDSNQVQKVAGSVVASDIHKTPGLLDWYTKRGFTIEDPTGREQIKAEKIVVWRRPVGIPK